MPTLTDRAMQALYLLGLDPIMETTADPNSYGFRSQRCCTDALKQCHIVLSGRHSASWVLESDLASCFDRIDPGWLLTNVPMDKALLRHWLKAGFLENQVFFATTEETPQRAEVFAALSLGMRELRQLARPESAEGTAATGTTDRRRQVGSLPLQPPALRPEPSRLPATL